MPEQLEVTVNLSNQKAKFTGVSRSNPPITFDYDPPPGDGQGYTGLEMLLMSLAACSGTSIVALLRNMVGSSKKDELCISCTSLRNSDKYGRRQ